MPDTAPVRTAPRGNKIKEYSTWRKMVSRCHNPRDKDYPGYGGRGIRVCEPWRESFEAFLADVGPAPSPKHSLDRFPDNGGHYEPGNVRWATPREQALNTRRTRFYEVGGLRVPQSVLAEQHGLPPQVLYKRVHKLGWDLDRALTAPLDQRFSHRTN